MKKYVSLISLTLLLLSSLNGMGQNPVPGPNDSAELLRKSGQIYLVILVLATIFAGILIMLVVLERKIKRLEKEGSSHN